MSSFAQEVSNQYIKLVSNDEQSFDLNVKAIQFSDEIQKLYEMNSENADDNDENEDSELNTYSFPNIIGETLGKIVSYLNHNLIEPMTKIPKSPLKSSKISDVVQDWYVQFIDVEIFQLCNLINAGEFLSIKSLLDLCCVRFATIIRDKNSIPQIADALGLAGLPTKEFTKEEEKKIREDNKWIDHATCELEPDV
jgi:S-phase kinase-associated protein 1